MPNIDDKGIFGSRNIIHVLLSTRNLMNNDLPFKSTKNDK